MMIIIKPENHNTNRHRKLIFLYIEGTKKLIVRVPIGITLTQIITQLLLLC